jgi:biopolymer transport protein ExbD
MLKKKRRIGISIDMTPMVDVAFLLLIFFMETAKIKPADVDEVHLPVSNSELKVPETGVITVVVNAAKPATEATADVAAMPAQPTRVKVVYQVMEQRKGGPPGELAPAEKEQAVDIANLAENLQLSLKAARIAQPSARMIIKMDKDAEFGVMADLMGALQAVNAPRFNVMTELGAKGGKLGSQVAK